MNGIVGSDAFSPGSGNFRQPLPDLIDKVAEEAGELR